MALWQPELEPLLVLGGCPHFCRASTCVSGRSVVASRERAAGMPLDPPESLRGLPWSLDCAEPSLQRGKDGFEGLGITLSPPPQSLISGSCVAGWIEPQGCRCPGGTCKVETILVRPSGPSLKVSSHEYWGWTRGSLRPARLAFCPTPQSLCLAATRGRVTEYNVCHQLLNYLVSSL